MSGIPEVFSNPTTNAIFLTLIPGLFYTLAAYGGLAFDIVSMPYAILFAAIFAVIEYIFRVPLIKYSYETAGMSTGTIQLVWIIITLAMSGLVGLCLKK